MEELIHVGRRLCLRPFDEMRGQPMTEVKALQLEKAEDTGEFVIRFAIKRDAKGRPVVDKDGDVYEDGAVGEQNVIVGCWNHGDSCPGPAGVGGTAESESDIRASGRLLLETSHGSNEHARWKALGEQAEFSYRFRVVDFDYIALEGQQVRRLKRMEVVSIDLVDNPAGVGTGIVSLKDCGWTGSCSCGDLTEAEKQGFYLSGPIYMRSRPRNWSRFGYTLRSIGQRQHLLN